MTVRHSYVAATCVGAAILLLVSTALAADSATDEPRIPRHGNLRVDSNLVLIPVSVTDSKNHPVLGIDAGQFRVFDGKAEQHVLKVSTYDEPVSVGIVFDSSASMTAKLPKAREAVAQFLNDANPEDEFFLVNFSGTAEVSVPFTTNGSEIRNRLMYDGTKGKTALLDAVYLALETMKDARNPRKALLVISDGGDNDSRYTETEVRRAVRETGVWIYAIGIYGNEVVTLPEEERGGPLLLTKLAEETGGRHFAAQKASELPEAAKKIALELRNQYLVGFQPENVEANGSYHKLQVKVQDTRKLQLSWRPGYYAPVR